MKNIYLLLLFFLICCSQSEDDSNTDFSCTLIFKTEVVEVTGAALDDFYSLRLSNGDTLRLENYNSSDIYYPILNDNSIPHIKGIVERIDFVAIRRNQIQKMPYTFATDGCHIIKKSGLDVINF